MIGDATQRAEAVEPTVLDKALLLEPAPLLMQKYNISLSGVNDLWRRIATQHSLLLTDTESVVADLAALHRPVMSVAELMVHTTLAARARIPTSLATLDAALGGGGFRPGQLIELTASPTALPTARQLVQKWACNTLCLSTSSGVPPLPRGADDGGHAVYWLTASAGAAAADACAAMCNTAPSARSVVFPVSVSDVESLESEVVPAVRTHRSQRCAARGRGAGARCLVVVDDLSTLVRRSFPTLWEARTMAASARDDAFTMYACLQRLVEKLKALVETEEAVCVLLTEQHAYTAARASATDGAASTAAEDGALGRAFVHGMSLRLALRDGLWCVQSSAPSEHGVAVPRAAVGRRAELRVVKSAVCAPFALLAVVAQRDSVVTVEEVDVLVSPLATSSASQAALSVGVVHGGRTRAELLVAESYLECLDGWDHTSRPRFMGTDG